MRRAIAMSLPAKLSSKRSGRPGTSTAMAGEAAAEPMSHDVVRAAYRRWAPIYDATFGRVAAAGRRHAARIINQRSGRLLEVGVGTGLSLTEYDGQLEVVGIDLSPEMLKRAKQRVHEEQLRNVRELLEMDAGHLEFPEDSFETVAAMFVMTVVPEPERVMREIARVTRPGGEVIIVNHFSTEGGARGWVERRLAPFADILGWRPVFGVERVAVCENLELVERRPLAPFGLFTLLRFVKRG